MAPPGWWRYGLLLQAGSWLFPLLLLPVAAWSPASLLFSWDRLSGLTAIIVAFSLLVVSMLMVGGGQGFALRPLLRYPRRWTAVPGIALLTSGLVVIGLNFTLLPLIANLVHSGTFSMALPSTGFISPTVGDKLGMVWVLLQLLIAILASGTYGLVTGVALVTLADDGDENALALA